MESRSFFFRGSYENHLMVEFFWDFGGEIWKFEMRKTELQCFWGSMLWNWRVDINERFIGCFFFFFFREGFFDL